MPPLGIARRTFSATEKIWQQRSIGASVRAGQPFVRVKADEYKSPEHM